MTTETLPATRRNRRPRGQYPKRADQGQETALKPLPQYLEAHDVQAIIRASDDPRARLLMTEQWRADLRVSKALALEVADLSLDAELPTICVRSGKGRKSRIVPVHPELGAAFQTALGYGDISEGRIIDAHRTTAWRWVQKAVERAEQLGAIPLGREVSTHTFRHSYAKHLLMNCIPINYLSRWLGHNSIQTTLIYRGWCRTHPGAWRLCRRYSNILTNPESTEESWYLCRSVGKGRGKIAVRV